MDGQIDGSTDKTLSCSSKTFYTIHLFICFTVFCFLEQYSYLFPSPFSLLCRMDLLERQMKLTTNSYKAIFIVCMAKCTTLKKFFTEAKEQINVGVSEDFVIHHERFPLLVNFDMQSLGYSLKRVNLANDCNDCINRFFNTLNVSSIHQEKVLKKFRAFFRCMSFFKTSLETFQKIEPFVAIIDINSDFDSSSFANLTNPALLRIVASNVEQLSTFLREVDPEGVSEEQYSCYHIDTFLIEEVINLAVENSLFSS